MKILIVEDDFSLALEIEMYLKSLGYTNITIAGTGKQALKEVGSGEPDLLIVDVNLNGDFSGIDVVNKITDKMILLFLSQCSRMKKHSKKQCLPVLLVF